MSALSPEKVVLPAPGDTYGYLAEQRAMAASQRSIVSVANRAEGDQVAAAMLADSRPITDNNPLYVYNIELKGVEFKGAEGVWRPLAGVSVFGHMGRTGSFQQLNGTPGKIIMSAAQTLVGGVTFSDADDCLVLPYTGRYNVRAKGFFSGGASAVNQTGLWINGAYASASQYQALTSSANKDTSGADIMVHSAANMSFTAGDKVGLWQASNVSAWGTNGWDGSWLEVEYTGA